MRRSAHREALLLLEERLRRRRERLRETIRESAAVRRVPRAEDVAAFAELAMRTDDGRPIVPAPHHRLWLSLLCDEEIGRLLIVAPPESAKTTWIVAYLATSIGFDPEAPRIVAASAGSVAMQRIASVRLLVESAEFARVFGPIRRATGLEYTTDRWSVARAGVPFPGRLHPTVSAYGTGGAITGSRAVLLVGDDILDYENTRTPHQRRTVSQWLYNSFLSRLQSGRGRTVLIGTSWHYDDVYERIRRSGQWVVCHVPLLSAGPDVYATITYPIDHGGTLLGEDAPEVVEDDDEETLL